MENIFLTDSHCHLTFDREDGLKPSFLVKEAQQAGVTTLLTICTKHKEWPTLQAFAAEHASVFCTYGLHPNHVGGETVSAAEFTETCEAAAADPKTVGLGESGLDYHYHHSAPHIQRLRFEAHLEAARGLNLPLVIHTRDAEDDTMKLVDACLAKGNTTLIFHCFTGSQKLADFATERGIYVSASGVITFNKSAELRQTFRTIPAERLLIETDSPYLAPMPYRSKQNRPAWVAKVAECLAKERETTLKAVAEVTTANTLRAFPKVTNWRKQHSL